MPQVTPGKFNPLQHPVKTFETLRKRPLKNIVEKEENAGTQHFLLFPQCFLPYERQISCFE